MKNNYIISIFLIGLYLVTRLPNLTILPIFADEAIYIRWAQQIAHNKDLAFLPLYDGKTPLFIWVLIPFLHFDIIDPLWTSRFASVLAGLATFWLVGQLARELGGGIQAMRIAQIFYIFTPITLFYDRMALIDGFFSMMVGLFMLCGFYTIKLNSWKWTVTTGIVFGLTILTKLPGIFLVLLLFGLPIYVHQAKLANPNRSIYYKMALILILGFCLFSLTRTSQWFPFLFQRSNDFRFSMEQIIGGDWLAILKNQREYVDWIVRYFGLGICVLPILGWYLTPKNKRGELITVFGFMMMGLVFLAPILLMGKVVYSRYLLPLGIFWLPAVAVQIHKLLKHGLYRLTGSGLTLVLVQGIIFGLPALVSPDKIPFARKDVEQYLSSWSAGYGVYEVVNYLRDISKSGNSVVATEGFFGTLPDGLFVYLDHTPILNSVEIYGIGLPILSVPKSLIEKTNNIKDGFIVANANRIGFDYHNQCLEIMRVNKPMNGAPLLLLKCITNL